MRIGRTWLAPLIFCVCIASGVAADRLPFPDGSYASKPKFCKMGKEAAIQEYEFAFFDIKGNEISNYDVSCEVQDVSVKGDSVKFKQVCEAEGETSVDRVTWKKLSATSFSDRHGGVWTGCGGFVE